MARDCYRPKRERKEEANLTQAAEEQPALLMAVHAGLVQIADEPAHETVNLNKEKVLPTASPTDVWYLDTGAINHMTGDRNMFSSIDETVTGTVKFADRSAVNLMCASMRLMRVCFRYASQCLLPSSFHVAYSENIRRF